MNHIKPSRSQTLLKVVGTVSVVALASAAALFMFNSNYSNQGAQVLGDFQPQVPFGSAMFYEDEGFKGRRRLELSLSTRTNVNLDQLGYNDCLSSFQIGEGVRVKICKHTNCQEEDHWDNALDIIGPYNSATMNDVNDMASHVIIYPYDSKNEKYIQGFSRERFEAGYAGIFAEGQYDSEDIKRHHLDKGGYGGALTSIVVPEGLIATLYKEDYYRGERLVIQGPKTYDFQHSEVEHWNHEMRSLQVLKVQHAKIDVLTQWERVSSGSGTITHVIQKGWSKDIVQKDEKTVLEEFTATAEAGFNFMGAYEKTTLTNHISLNIFSSCQRSIHQSKITTDTVVCDNPERQLVALYQWTLTGTQDGENDIYIQDANYICRYGLNSNTGPACPLTMCANSECTQCTGSFLMSTNQEVSQ